MLFFRRVMFRSFFIFIILICSLGLVQAKQSNQVISPTSASSTELLSDESCKNIANFFKIYQKKKDNPSIINEVAVRFRLQYGLGWVDPAGGSNRVAGAPYGKGRNWFNEFRRLNGGIQIKFLEKWQFQNVWTLGGMQGLDTFNKGNKTWNHNDTKYSLFTFSLSHQGEHLTYGIGKQMPRISGEYRLTSDAIITMERSSIVEMIRPELNYGFNVKTSKKDSPWGWAMGIWLSGNGNMGDDKNNNRIEPVFNEQDNCFTTSTLDFDTSGFAGFEKSRLWIDYSHNFSKLKDTNYNKFQNYYTGNFQGTGARDVLAITWEATHGKLNLMAELIGAWNMINMPQGAENAYGLVLIPSYNFTPHIQGVCSLEATTGSKACRINRRLTTNTNYSNMADQLQSIYLGVNYHFCPEKPHMMKLMFGVQYLHSQGSELPSNKPFTGWSYNMGYRCEF